MSVRAVATSRAAGLVLLLAVATACSPAPVRPSGDTDVRSTAVTVPPATTPPASPPAQPTPVPGSQAPVARLTGVGESPAPGALGSSCWDGACSDAPWLPGTDAGSAVAGARLAVEFDPPIAHSAWTAAWASLANGQPGSPMAGETGTDGPVELTLPGRPGQWSLQVFARFGGGRDAAWYWRVDVAP